MKDSLILVRKATVRDLPSMRKIDTFGKQLDAYEGLDKLDPKYKEVKGQQSYFEKFIYGRTKWCLVAEVDKKVVGFTLFNIERRAEYFRLKRVGYIDMVVVDKAARGKGVARKLVGETTKMLKSEGMTHLKLSVHTENPAHKVWEKLGFRDFRIDMWKKI